PHLDFSGELSIRGKRNHRRHHRRADQPPWRGCRRDTSRAGREPHDGLPRFKVHDLSARPVAGSFPGGSSPWAPRQSRKHSEGLTMNHFRTQRLTARRLLIVAAAFTLTAMLPHTVNGYLMSLAISGALLALAAMPLTLLTGTAGLLSLGHAAFLGLGGYTVGVLAAIFWFRLTASTFIGSVVGMS